MENEESISEEFLQDARVFDSRPRNALSHNSFPAENITFSISIAFYFSAPRAVLFPKSAYFQGHRNPALGSANTLTRSYHQPSSTNSSTSNLYGPLGTVSRDLKSTLDDISPPVINSSANPHLVNYIQTLSFDNGQLFFASVIFLLSFSSSCFVVRRSDQQSQFVMEIRKIFRSRFLTTFTTDLATKKAAEIPIFSFGKQSAPRLSPAY